MVYAGIAIPDKQLPSEQIAKNLFLEDPGLSIDDVARALANAGKGMDKHLISRIRTDVRQSISSAGQPRAVPPVLRNRHGNPFAPTVQVINAVPKAIEAPAPKASPFNPPRMVIPTPMDKPRVVSVPATAISAVAAVPKPEIMATRPEVSLAEKRKWLEDWLLENPTASVAKAQKAVKEQFGEMMSQTNVSNAVKLMREITGQKIVARNKHLQDKIREVTPPPQPMQVLQSPIGLAELAQAMKTLGIRKIELSGHHYIAELED